jgi:hypothetical protein
MSELVGSPKQVQGATQIRDELVGHLDRILMGPSGGTPEAKWQVELAHRRELKEAMLAQTSAAWWIEHRHLEGLDAWAEALLGGVRVAQQRDAYRRAGKPRTAQDAQQDALGVLLDALVQRGARFDATGPWARDDEAPVTELFVELSRRRGDPQLQALMAAAQIRLGDGDWEATVRDGYLGRPVRAEADVDYHRGRIGYVPSWWRWLRDTLVALRQASPP